jgi:TP901 family phage tail tape measure protein
MAQDLKITSIVDQKVIDQVKALGEAFESAKEKYSALALKLAEQVTIKVTGYTELKEKAKGGNAILKELSETQTKLAQIQKDYKDLLKQVSDQTKENVKQILEEAKANKLNADAELALQKVETERLKQQKLSNQESKKRNYTVEEGVSALKMEIKTMKDAETQNKILRSARKEIDLTTEEGRKTVLRFNEVIERNDNLLKKNSDALIQAKMNVGRYKEDIKAATSEILKGNISLQNMGSIAKNTGGLLRSSVGAGITEVKIGIGSMIKGIVGAQAVIGGIQKLIGLLKSGVRSIIDFEAANSNLAAILGTTSNRIKDLTVDAQRLGATTKYTASQATALQIELAKLGFSRDEILQSTEYVLKFAQATGAELPEAAALAGAALRMFNADTSETERYVSAMAVATTKSALSFSYLQTAMPIVGPVAKAFNFQIEDTLALLGKLSDAGFDASMAATATRNIFLNLADSGGKLAKALGGPVKTLPELIDGLKRLKEQGIDLNSTLELTDKRSVAAFNAFLTAADKIVPLREQITGVGKELGDMADTMGDNVQGAIANLSSAWESLMLSFSGGTGAAKEFINWVATKIREIADLLKDPEQRAEEDAGKLQLAAQKEVQTKMETQELEFQIRIEKLKKEYRSKYLNEGLKEEEANAKAIEEAQIKAAEEALVELSLIKARQKEIYEEDLKRMDKAKGIYTQTLKEWEETSSFLGFNFKNAFAKMFNYETDEIKNVNKAFTDFANIKMDITKAESYNKALDKMIEKMKQIIEPVKENTTQELTDKEKRELEKAAKERLKIRETLQQLELDLMDEGLKKELVKISFDYNRRIAAIKGNSDDETKIRERLAQKMQEDLEKATISYGLDKEKKQISDKLELVKKGSEEEFELRKKQLELEREIAINAAIDKNEDVFVVDEIYNKKFIDLEEKRASEINKKLQDSYSSRSILINAAMSQELDDLTEEYTKGIINAEAYERSKAEIAEKYAIQQAEQAVDLAKKLANTPGISDEDRLKLEQEISKAEIVLAEQVRDAKINASKRTADSIKKEMDKTAESIQAIADLLGGFADLGSAIYDRKIEEIESEQDANDEAYERELERIESLEQKGAISTEEAEARKRAAEEKTASKEAELAKKKAQLQIQQAKLDKTNNIIQTIMNTAVAIMKAWGQAGIFGAPLAAIIAAQGAIQLATIIAQPIPKYAKGTDNHPGGLAIVGDGGRREGILTNKGLFATPSIPTLVDLPKGAAVVPDLEQYISVRPLLRSDLGAMAQDAEREGIPFTVNVDTGALELRKEIRILTDEVRKLSKARRKEAVQRELDYLHRTI